MDITDWTDAAETVDSDSCVLSGLYWIASRLTTAEEVRVSQVAAGVITGVIDGTGFAVTPTINMLLKCDAQYLVRVDDISMCVPYSDETYDKLASEILVVMRELRQMKEN